jgi:pimeloyl-ACP methyl ester carboxylesterase
MGISRSKQPGDHGFYEINGHKLYWEQYGPGNAPVLLLLHHGLGSIRSWRRQISALTNAGWRVIAYDRWGYGRSEIRPCFEESFLLNDAEEAFALLNHLDIHRLSLVGHSDGGSIALLMASARPDLIERMIVVAAHIYFEPKMLPGLVMISEASKQPPYSKALGREHGGRARHLVDSWVRHWKESEPQKLDMRERLPKITCPTLVIQGELDEHATPQHAVDISEGVQEGQVWLIPDVHHMPPHEIPEEFNQRVLRFLAVQEHAQAPAVD